MPPVFCEPDQGRAIAAFFSNPFKLDAAQLPQRCVYNLISEGSKAQLIQGIPIDGFLVIIFLICGSNVDCQCQLIAQFVKRVVVERHSPGLIPVGAKRHPSIPVEAD